MLRSNPGLKSRIRHQIVFDDYSAEELADIFIKFANDDEFILEEQAYDILLKLMKNTLRMWDKDFGNGRFVRNAFEKTIEKMALRVVNHDLKENDDLKKNTVHRYSII